jgi:2-polyprenyl-3-methyl-5-hydroxy-6-metoxy-1,4-benzoquinol methylase
VGASILLLHADAAHASRCRLCHTVGTVLHSGLRDRLFGAEGRWRLAKCPNAACGLVWLDPSPSAESLSAAYASYYTHNEERQPTKLGLLRRAYRSAKWSYLTRRFGYVNGTSGVLHAWMARLFAILPLVRAQAEDEELRQLRAVHGGKLLDVGCGSGKWLASMRERGWVVAGVDFDAAAVSAGTRRGLSLAAGSLEAQRYPDAAFDAVTLNHVIEHLPDPVATLTECRRVLKPGGQFILYTPNVQSLGYRLFGQHWRGLEPPRHLHLFSSGSIRVALERAGFAQANIRTVNSGYIWRQSLALRIGAHGHNMPRAARAVQQVLAQSLRCIEQMILVVRPDVGECIAVKATVA